MAFGLFPKYIQALPLDSLTPEQFIVLALEAVKRTGWNISYASETGLIAYTGISFTSWGEEVKVKIENDVATIKSESTGSQMVDWGRNKENVEKFVEAFNDLKSSLSSDEVAAKYADIQPTLVSKEQDVLSQPPPTTKEKLTSVLAIFKPTEGYFITPILINLNILLFVLMVVISGANILLPDNEALLKWGANFRPITLEGQWWRLLSNCFLHIGIFHLLMNMYALLYIGLLLEPHLGRSRFLAAYLITGIAASTTSLCWHDLTISAGASGAIFGMYGVFLAMLSTNLIEKSARKTLLTSIGIFVVYNLVNGLKGGIDNAAHIGGLISGLFVGYAYYPSLKKPSAYAKYAAIGALGIIVTVSSYAVCVNLPNDIGLYDKKMESFVSMEAMAMEIYNLPPNTPKEKVLSEINDRGLYYWKENIKLLDEVKKLNLPFEIRYRNDRLREYCELRIKSYNLIYKTVQEDTDSYKDSIQQYNKQIESIISSLKTNSP